MTAAEQLAALIAARTSCRHYQTRPVPEAALTRCLEAARLAPSACNRQPWRFVIVRDRALLDRLAEQALLPGLPMPWLGDAPVIAVLCTQRKLAVHRLAPLISGVHYDLIDCGIAGEHFVLAAEAEGLGTCWIGWFKARVVRKLLGLPFGVEPLSLISLGYPAEKTPPRSRLELGEIARSDRWDRPWPEPERP